MVLIDFWTYTCINCLRTLPHVRAWADRYEKDGLTVVGVHTPEFSFEKDTGNVRRAIERNRLHYPVLQDNDYDTWTAWGNQYWPAKYLIDGLGRVRYTHFGEGDYDATEKAIRTLLRETGRSSLGGYTRARGEVASAGHVHAGDLSRLRPSPGLRAQGARARRAPIRRPRLAAGQRVRARRNLEGGEGIGHRGERGDGGRALQRAPRVPGAQLPRGQSARGPGPARRPPRDRRPVG